MKNPILDGLVGKRIKVVQKDGFVKFGVFEDYDDKFLYLRFEDGEKVAIAWSYIDCIGEVRKKGKGKK